MGSYEELQDRMLRLPSIDRSRLAIAMLESLDDEPADEGVAEAWAQEVLARSSAYSRGELQAVAWRDALQTIETDLKKT